MGQIQQGLAAGPGAGANKTAGGINGAAQLIAALMKAQKQRQIQQQLNAGQTQNQPPQVTPMYPDQGQTTSAPTAPPGTMANPGGAF